MRFRTIGIIVLLLNFCFFGYGQVIIQMPFSFPEGTSESFERFVSETMSQEVVKITDLYASIKSNDYKDKGYGYSQLYLRYWNGNSKIALVTAQCMVNLEHLADLVFCGNKVVICCEYAHARFGTHEFDYIAPINTLLYLSRFLKEEGATNSAIKEIITQLLDYFITANKYGPGGGYYESIEYNDLSVKYEGDRGIWINMTDDPNQGLFVPSYEEMLRKEPGCLNSPLEVYIEKLANYIKKQEYAGQRKADKESLLSLWLFVTNGGGLNN